MLTGEYKHTLDSKGRVFVPARFRADLGQNVTITTIFGEYVGLYSDEEWTKQIEKLDELCSQGIITERMLRAVMQSALSVEVDSQGRISICENQRNAAELIKDVTFIGMRNHVEIWGDEKLAAQNVSEEELQDFKALSRKLHLGLG